MLRIKIDDVDKMSDLITEIGLLVYLQGLVRDNVEDEQNIYKNAMAYLIENQLEKIGELNSLITNEKTFFE